MNTQSTLMTGTVPIDWNAITRFNFTYAIPGGAWLEWQNGDVNWYSFDYIAKHKGNEWIDRQIKRQGMFTGCWVDVC